VAMMRVADTFPWASWREAGPELDALIAVAADWWTLRGVRPANQPRLRLAQYRAWIHRVRDWPDRLRAWPLPPWQGADVEPPGPAELRRHARLAEWRESAAHDLCGGELGGTRLDTWFINLLFPFLAADRADAGIELWWRAWFPGDAPESLLSACRQVAPLEPRHNG